MKAYKKIIKKEKFWKLTNFKMNLISKYKIDHKGELPVVSVFILFDDVMNGAMISHLESQM